MAEILAAPALPGWLASLVPYDRFLVDLDGHRMHVMETRPEERGRRGAPDVPTVLMVHGNPTWGFLYRKVVAAVPPGRYRSVLPDLIGLGFSDKPRDPSLHTLDNHQRWLGRLIETLDLRKVLLVVQDWGGPIGLGAFAGREDRLAGLVILNTVVTPPKAGFRGTAFHRFARLPLLSELVFRGLGFPQVALWTAQGDRRSIRGEVARAYRYPLRRIRDRKAPLALARMVPDAPTHPSITGLERCRDLVTSAALPAAVVWGERDPVLGRALRHIERLLPDAPVVRTTAGHFLQEEVPSEIASAIVEVASRIA
jgi:pimeloyl-ACP methyl ester carboxylesterase